MSESSISLHVTNSTCCQSFNPAGGRPLLPGVSQVSCALIFALLSSGLQYLPSVSNCLERATALDPRRPGGYSKARLLFLLA